jgi:polyhydroxyalkanoate synthase
MKPVQSFAEKYITLSERMNDEAFLENFLAMERWANDNIPVAGETFREYVKMLYRENRIVKGEMRLNETPIRLENIVCPLLLLTASSDHLVPPQSTLAIQEHGNSTELTSLSVDAGHIGLAVSSKAHRKLWPVAAKWIADHSTTRNNGSIAN